MDAPLQNELFIGDVEDLRKSLLEWFDLNGRHWIPWKLKGDGRIPRNGEALPVYGIWIAEVMLQQTQLKIVLPYWKSWMLTFPSIIELAESDIEEVLLKWQGLGYYSRARRLHDASRILLQFNSVKNPKEESFWPRQLEGWIQLPGVGRSSAGSILSSAFDLPFSLLDGNLKRIFSRLIASNTYLHRDEKRLWDLSNQLLDPLSPRKFNQALMDLGATVCLPKNPNCLSCPLSQHCVAYSFYDPRDFPLKNVKKSVPHYIVGIGIVLNSSGQVLIAQRLESQSMGGLWEFPGGKQEKGESIEFTIIRELKEELSIDIEVGEKLLEIDHAFSHKTFHFIVHICKLIAGDPKPLESQQLQWVYPIQLENYPFPAANAKMISALHKFLN